MGYKLLKRTRKFLGKTTGFADKKERNFEKNHLKAYLAGRKIFSYGFQDTHQGRSAENHIVQQELIQRK
jgi:hypothetical protein